MSKPKNATKYPGVRYREHATRKHGVRYDKYFFIRYKSNGKDKEEGLGWASEGMTAEKASKILGQIKENIRNGAGPCSLSEIRDLSRKEREAHEAAAKSEAQRLISVADFFEQEFMPFAIRSKQEGSARKEFTLFRLWIEPVLGDTPLVNISRSDWSKLLLPMDRANLSVATKRYVCGTLCRILRLAQDQGHEVHDIPTMKKIGIGQLENNRRLRVISDEELTLILRTLHERNLCAYHIVVFGALTGCRFSEAASLTWGDVSEDRGIIFRKTKNKQMRIIPFSEPLRQFFAYLERDADTELVFKNTRGGKYGEAPRPFRDVVEILKLNEHHERLDRISYHSFRHTLATKLASLLDIRSLMDTLGWKQVSMAARYMHGNETLKKNALDAVTLPFHGEAPDEKEENPA